jgi:Calcineurin-like phosphoesterase
MLYDIIGDLHGHADALVRLLTKMGYDGSSGVWHHPDRMAIFVGDFIDLGPKQVETVMIVKHMVESGSALAVLGNHDLNAIAWFLPDPSRPSEYLRSHFSEEWGAKNRHQHSAFLAEVESNPELHRSIIDWFLTLPLWLDLPELRVVHACWHSCFIEYLSPILLPGGRLSKELMVAAVTNPELEDASQPSIFQAVEALTKGIEVPLPENNSFSDKYGISRTRVRVRWWNEQATTYQAAALLDESLREKPSDAKLPEGSRVFHATDVPVFIGHYWLTGPPSPLTDKVACVDYSVGHGGPLCAYRWQGEVVLNEQNYCCVSPVQI